MITQDIQDSRIITVRGGYTPAKIEIPAGRPVRLVFDRQEASSCSAELLIPAFGIETGLSAFGRTTVEFTPEAAGTYEFTCGMGMLRGNLVVTDATSRWQVDPDHTNVGFDVKHLMISRVRGRFGSLRGELLLDEADFTRSRVSIEADADSIDTGQPMRDNHLRSDDFFDVDRYPELSFESTGIVGTLDRFQLVGQLTIRDVTRSVTFDAQQEGRHTDPSGEARIAYSASTVLDRRDFGLTYNQALETGGVLIGNDVRITIDIQAVRQV